MGLWPNYIEEDRDLCDDCPYGDDEETCETSDPCRYALELSDHPDDLKEMLE